MEGPEKKVDAPLFPGYVFVSIAPEPEEFLNVVKTRGTVKFVSLIPGHPTPVAPEEIDSLKILLGSGEHIDLYPHLREGTQVRVIKGAFQGARGILMRRHDTHVFLVSIDMLGRSVAVRISAEDVEAA